MFFEAEGTSVRVVILDQALWADRQKVMDCIMRASASAGKVSRTYLALPKTAASVTDARIFQERGIGLFTYDQRNIEEALPARYFEVTNAFPHHVDDTTTSQLQNELRELRVEFAELEQAVQHLKEQLESSKEVFSPSRPAPAFTSRKQLPEVQVVASLPTFFAGNPWVEVLSRRGREEIGIVS